MLGKRSFRTAHQTGSLESQTIADGNNAALKNSTESILIVLSISSFSLVGYLNSLSLSFLIHRLGVMISIPVWGSQCSSRGERHSLGTDVGTDFLGQQLGFLAHSARRGI